MASSSINFQCKQRGSFKCGYINIIAISQDEKVYIQMKTAREVLIDKNPQVRIATAETLIFNKARCR